jgi:hypothetical protein
VSEGLKEVVFPMKFDIYNDPVAALAATYRRDLRQHFLHVVTFSGFQVNAVYGYTVKPD